MMNRKTQYGWMAVGAMLCLLGIGIALKMRDSSKVVAQPDPQVAQSSDPVPDPPPPPKEDAKKAEPKTPEPPVAPPDLSPPPPLPRDDAKKAEPKTTEPPIAPPDLSLPQPPPPGSRPAPPAPAPPSTNVDAPPPLPSAVVPPPLPPPSINEGPPMPPAPDAKNPAVMPPAAPMGEGVPMPQPSPMPPVDPLVDSKLPSVPEKIPAPMPASAIVPVSANSKMEVGPGEPPLAAVVGPLQMYEVRAGGETIQEVARHTLGAGERWMEIQKLNPGLKAGTTLAAGTLVRLPAEACVAITEEIEVIKPLPAMRPKSTPAVVKKLLPLTGTYPCTIDEKHVLTLPKALRDQLGNADTVLVSPGPDQCLWITNQAHLERLAERLELSPAKEMDVRVFKRLYYAQTEKVSLTAEGTMAISEKLVQFAGLRQDVVLVGIDEHFEVWDAAKWRAYTQQKSAEARAAMMEHE
jgi:division/cell wall cluster transcriptional repressor MraZ